MDIRAQFSEIYGRSPMAVARAPGRVEFIGNHTDYNGGAVLGLAIDRYVRVATAANQSGSFRLTSLSERKAVALPTAPSSRLGGADAWANYILGIWHGLAEFKLPYPRGFDLLVETNLPAGAGLSSSAALELATALALVATAGGAPLPPAQLALLGRHVENKYVGVPCGILDQATTAFGTAEHLVRIDCRGPHFSREPLPASARVWIFNTREKYALIDGLYAARHRECLAAAEALGADFLTDVSPDRFHRLRRSLSAVEARRAQHVIEEHARVHATVTALRVNDLPAVGQHLLASHRSSQRLFENSTPTLDRLVSLLEFHPQVYGARLTGGGFGGAVMALATGEFSAADAQCIAKQVTPKPDILRLSGADGAQLESAAAFPEIRHLSPSC